MNMLPVYTQGSQYVMVLLEELSTPIDLLESSAEYSLPFLERPWFIAAVVIRKCLYSSPNVRRNNSGAVSLLPQAASSMRADGK